MRKLVAAALTGALWCAGAATALAHVTVNPPEASKGSFAKFDVRVPNERPAASTVKVRLRLPSEQPVAFVSVQPVAGWTHEVFERHLQEPITDDEGSKIEDVASTIVWTAAEGGGIKPGEFVEFPVSMGPLPEDADGLVFRATQTYDSGEVVRWIEVGEEGKAEPDHPAPMVTLVEGAGGDVAASSGTQSEMEAASGRSTVALIVSLIAAALAAGAMIGRRGRPAAPSPAASE